MKKSIIGVVLTAVMLLATSGLTRGDASISVGKMAPNIELANDSVKTSLEAMRGEYVLLTFWSSDDANSRIQCNRYSAWVRESEINNLQHVSVNFDEEPVLFSEISRLDNLEPYRQFNIKGEAARALRDEYSLTHGYGTLLIDPDGKIVSFNPQTSEISSLI